MGVKEVFVYLESLGFVNVLIPFVLVFIILYAVLEKVKLFKQNKINAVLSALIAFIAIAAADVVRNVNLLSYYLVLFVFVTLLILVFIAMLGGKLNLMSDKYLPYFRWFFVITLCFVVLFGLYLSGIRLDISVDSYRLLEWLIPAVIVILVFVLIVWYISSGSGAAGSDGGRATASGRGRERASAERAPGRESEPTDEEKAAEKKGRVPKWVLEKVIKDLKDKERIDLSK